MQAYASVSRAEVAHLLRIDSAIAHRWLARFDWIPGLSLKWSVLGFEVWCAEFADEMDADDADSWVREVDPSFLDWWQQEATWAGLVAYPWWGIGLTVAVVPGCGAASAIAAPSWLLRAAGVLPVASVLALTWSQRRSLCGPAAHGLCVRSARAGRTNVVEHDG
jgi:hypothetical protein